MAKTPAAERGKFEFEDKPEHHTHVPPIEPVGSFDWHEGEVTIHRGAALIRSNPLESKRIKEERFPDLEDSDFRQILWDIADYFPRAKDWNRKKHPQITVRDRHKHPTDEEGFPMKTYQAALREGEDGTYWISDIALIAP